MEPVTVILTVVTILLAITCILLIIFKYRSFSDSEKASAVSGLYGIAKTVYDALKDGKLESGEIKVLFNSVVALIAQVAGKHTDEVEEDFKQITGETQCE